MIVLDATTKTLEVKLSGAVTTNQLPFYAAYVDVNTSDESVSAIAENDGQTNNTTAVVPVAAPSAGKTRTVKFLNVYNADTVAAVVIVQINNNGTVRKLASPTLQPGETLQYEG